MKLARDEEFRRYVTEERAALVRTATLLTAGDAHLAEDLVQTALVRLYGVWPSFRVTRSPAAYARRALVNALIDERRRPWRRERALPEVPDQAVPTDVEDPRVEQVHQALRALPERMRAAVVLRYVEDLSVLETAEALGCSQGTVKSQVSRALVKLREQLGDLLPPGADDPPPPIALLPDHHRTDLATTIRSTR